MISFTLQDELEKAMKIDIMTKYANNYKETSASSDPAIIGLQHQIIDLTEKLKDINITRTSRLQV